MSSCLPILMVAFTFQAAPAPAQKALEARALEAGIQPDELTPLLATLHAAEEQGLPVESVRDKILEGLAKGVPPGRIVIAAQEVARRLGTAQQVLDAASMRLTGEQRKQALDRLALVQQSVDGPVLVELARLSQGADPEGLLSASRGLAELARRGVTPREAIRPLSLMARGPGKAEGLVSLFDEYLAEGGSHPNAFLSEVEHRLDQGLPLEDLIDPFAEDGEPLRRVRRDEKNRSNSPGKAGKPSLEKSNRSGSAPGLDPDSRARREHECGKKGKAPCK